MYRYYDTDSYMFVFQVIVDPSYSSVFVVLWWSHLSKIKVEQTSKLLILVAFIYYLLILLLPKAWCVTV